MSVGNAKFGQSPAKEPIGALGTMAIKWAVFTSGGSVLGFPILLYANFLHAAWIVGLLGSLATLVLLWHALSLLSMLGGILTPARTNCCVAYIVLHPIPFAFGVAWNAHHNGMLLGWVALPWLFLFFSLGRITWRAMYSIFNSKIYSFFYRGNTCFLVSLCAGTATSLVYNPSLGYAILRRMVLTYFCIHFVALGLVVLKLQRDLCRKLN